MKWLIFIAFISSMQMCSPACVVKRSADSYKWSDTQIDNFRKELKRFPGIDPFAVDEFATVLNNFRENSTEHDMFEGILKLLSISIDADFAKINQTVSEQMYSSTDNTLKVEKAFSINSERLNNLENSLSKDLTPFQTKRVMDVLRALSEDGTSNQTDAIVVQLFTSAMQVALHMPKKRRDQNTDN